MKNYNPAKCEESAVKKNLIWKSNFNAPKKSTENIQIKKLGKNHIFSNFINEEGYVYEVTLHRHVRQIWIDFIMYKGSHMAGAILSSKSWHNTVKLV